MKVRVKIVGGFFIVVIIAAILGLIGITSIQRLTSMSDELLQLQTESTDFNSILVAHYEWRGNMDKYIITHDEFTGSLDPNGCALGKWLAENKDLEFDAEVQEHLNHLKEPHNIIHTVAGDIVALVEEGADEEAQTLFLNTVLPSAQEVIESLRSIDERYKILISDKNDEIIAEGKSAALNLTVVIVIAVIVAMGLGIVISRSITRPLKILSAFLHKAGTSGDIRVNEELRANINKCSKKKDEISKTVSSAASFVAHVTNVAEKLKEVAGGDLTVSMARLSDDDVMASSLINTVDSFNMMFTEINSTSSLVEKNALQVQDNTQAISSSMIQIAGASQLLAEGATQQAMSVKQLSEAIVDISDNTKTNADLAEKASRLADTVIADAQKGSRQMEDMIVAINEITEASHQINTIMETINDITSQTNLLSLNASIEAARAGEQGRGFAVVAGEVGNLAKESSESAARTNIIIQASIEKAELGARIVDETAKSLKEIIDGIEESSRFIKEIATASDEQLKGIQDINESITTVSDIVQQSSAAAEETAAAAQESSEAANESTGVVDEMASMSAALNNLLSQFKIN